MYEMPGTISGASAVETAKAASTIITYWTIHFAQSLEEKLAVSLFTKCCGSIV